MKFWPDDRSEGLYVAVAIFVLVLLGHRWNTSPYDSFPEFVLPALLVLICVGNAWRRSWELTQSALVRNGLIRTQTVPYADIVRVSFRREQWRKGPSEFWQIVYRRNGSIRSFNANPNERALFISTLRERAFNATFEGWPLPPPNPRYPQLSPPTRLPERLAKFARKPLRIPKC